MPNEQSSTSQPTVALVYDQATTTYGGAEHVLAALHELYPDAPLYTTMVDSVRAKWTNSFKVKTTFLQRIPFHGKLHRILATFAPIAFETLDLQAFDIVISVTSGAAKGVLTLPSQLHISYILTPPRYLYSHTDEYLTNHSFFSWSLIKPITTQIVKYLRWWDRTAAYRPDLLVGISNLVAERIQSYYQRSATVIYPTVIPVVSTTHQDSLFYLSLSRLVSYKRVDLSIRACLAAKQLLVVAGEGPEQHILQQLVPSQLRFLRQDEPVLSFISDAQSKSAEAIVFVGQISEEEKRLLFEHAKALLMPGLEDFGLVALEAAQHQIVSIVHSQSGIHEILKDTQHSFGLTSESVTELVTVVTQLEQQQRTVLAKLPNMNTPDHFKKTFASYVQDAWLSHLKQQH